MEQKHTPTPKWEITIAVTVNYSRDINERPDNPELKRYELIIEAPTEREAISVAKQYWHESNISDKGIWEIWSNGEYEGDEPAIAKAEAK